MKLSVIIPTIGRDTLEQAKASAAGADEIIVIPNQYGDHGYRARTEGIRKATGTHLAFLDDDDVYLPGAVEAMRENASDVPVIFRMDHPQHGILWREQLLEFGNVGTPMFLVPNRTKSLGVWESHAPGLKEPGGDFTFIRGCVERMGGVEWRQYIVCKVRPERPRSISIITPWLNHPELTKDYFDSVQFRREQDKVLVVDDASDPPLRFAAIRNDANEGFAYSCNAGLRTADTDAVLFLNNDIAATRADWLEHIRAALEPGVLVGAELRNDPHAAVDAVPMPYLDGWCLAGMTDDLRTLGGFDESYQEPSYYGDNDLSLRARMEGMTLREVKVGLRHLRNGTTGGSANPEVRAATLANRERFIARAREALSLV